MQKSGGRPELIQLPSELITSGPSWLDLYRRGGVQAILH